MFACADLNIDPMHDVFDCFESTSNKITTWRQITLGLIIILVMHTRRIVIEHN